MSNEKDDFKKMIDELKENGFKEVEVATFDSLGNIRGGEQKNEINKGTGNSRTQKNVVMDFKTDYEGLQRK